MLNSRLSVGIKITTVIFTLFSPSESFSSFWINPGGGDYLDPANWSPGVPGPSDYAGFNLSSSGYNVTLSGSYQNGALYIWDGNVNLIVDPGTIYTLSGPGRSLYVANGSGDISTLSVTGGTLVSLGSGATNDGIGIADGTGSTGSLTIDNSSLQATGDLHVGSSGNGDFNLQNSSVALTNGEVIVGRWDGSSGNVLVDASTWNNTGDFRIGSSGQGNISILNGGSVSTTGLISIANSSPGSVNVTGINSKLDSGAFLSIGGHSTGTLNISQGGEVFTSGNLYSPYFDLGNGVINISGSGSQLHIDGGNSYFGWIGTSDVTVSNGGLLYSRGHANIGTTLVDGTTTDLTNITVTGAGSKFVAGTAEPSGYWYLLLGNSVNPCTLSVENGALVETPYANIREAGFLKINNGTLTSYNDYNPYNITHYITNGGTILLNNGQVNGDITNNNYIDVSGAGVSMINGTLINNGSIKTTGTTLTVTGTFTNNGAYFSDPATNIFADIILDTNGYLVGGVGDSFVVNGNFTNNSTNNTSWNTDYATLVINGAGLHNVLLGSEDYGVDGVANNFNWGVLRLESGAGLQLLDSNGGGAAIYVGHLDLADGAGQLSMINSPFNIYYDMSLTENAYLAGQSISLAGGGTLAPGTFPAVAPLHPDLWLQVVGDAQGGTVLFSVEGVTLSVTTTNGLSPELVAEALAGAVNSNATLSAMGITASAVDTTVYINGSLAEVSTTDPGLVLTQGLGTLPLSDGDINLDGVVNVADILFGQQVLGGTAILTPSQLVHGDVAPIVGSLPAPDGLFTLGDLLVIQRKVLGQINF